MYISGIIKSMFKSRKNNLPVQSGIASNGVPQLIERVFTDQHGRQFKMVFLVAIVEGELKGKLVSVEPISASTLRLNGSCTESSGIIYLPVECTQKCVETAYIPSPAAVVSPYISLDFLMTSQPTRAPSCI
jgi:hypothetical protein